MICPRCTHETARLMIYASGSGCASCLGLSEAGGTRISGALTRSSFRIREQQLRHEGDFIPPHVFDRATKQMVPNPDFVNAYTNDVDNFFQREELEDAGYTKIGKIYEQKEADKAAVEAEKADVIFKQGIPDGLEA